MKKTIILFLLIYISLAKTLAQNASDLYGRKSFCPNYIDKNRKKQGKWEGTIMPYDYGYAYYKNDSLISPIFTFNKRGIIYQEGEHLHGLALPREGEYFYYRPNGIIRAQCYFKAGRVEGIARFFSKRGKLMAVYRYKTNIISEVLYAKNNKYANPNPAIRPVYIFYKENMNDYIHPDIRDAIRKSRTW